MVSPTSAYRPAWNAARAFCRVSSPSAISVTESGALTPFPHLRSELSTWNWGFTSPGAGQPETIKGLLSPGQYRAAASVGTSGATGDFTLTLNNSSLDVGCEDAIAFGTLALTQQLQTTDCKFTGTTQYYDDFAVGLPPGASVSASVSGTPFIPFVGVFLDTSYVAFQNGATSTGASTSYTNASTTGQFVDVVVSSTNVSSIRTGAYALALTITIPPGTSAAPNRIATAPMIPRSSRRLAIRTPPR